MNMRTEKEMFDLILGFARKDDRIRIVAMNGSRANPNVQPDQYQDFDIVYLVNEMDSFLANDSWLDVFGSRIIMQKPDTMGITQPASLSSFAYLMLFEDGNRIDLTLISLEKLETFFESDRMCVLLLDKDGLVRNLPPSTDQDYWLKPPSCKTFDDCCNEFWWLSTYVAKGLARGQLPYANAHLNLIRNELMRMLSWQLGFEKGFNFSIGKDYKYLQQHLEPEIWQALLNTWRMDKAENVWQSMLEACNLFCSVSAAVSSKLSTLDPDYAQKIERYVMNIYTNNKL